MPNSLACEDPSVKVIVGVDTHKHEHVAVAINGLGARLATGRAAANQAGYAELLAWARQFGVIGAFGIEGTGSNGVGLARFVRRQGLRVVEVNYCDRRKRRNNGKGRHARCRDRDAVRTGRNRDRHTEDRRWGGRNGPPDQGRPRYGCKGP